jgi:hypothetical protein
MEPSSQQAVVPPQSNPPCESPPNVAGCRRPPSRRNCDEQELFLNLLAIMKDMMPVGGEEWDKLLDHHPLRHPGLEVESLHRKFSQLHRKLTPADDPMCPMEVKLAKRAKHRISSSCADVGDRNEEMDLVRPLPFAVCLQGQWEQSPARWLGEDVGNVHGAPQSAHGS